jgi:predicted metal-dependent hydrolase
MNAGQGLRRPPGLRVKHRRMRFEFEEGFERYWHGGSPFRSLFWSQLSTAFEPGERFFIDSARALRGAIHDPALTDELAEFCKQEGHHTAQHLKFDRMNAAMGIDVEGCRRRYAAALDPVRKRLDALEMLAVTMALEHLTSGFAEQYFRRPELSAGSDPKVAALWAWHAAEEAEHKATCYDIYVAARGGYVSRVTTLLGAWTMILGISLYNTCVLLRRDGRLFTRDTLSGLAYLFGRRGAVTSLWPAFFAYFKPSFHPWKRDDSALIAEWQARNARYITNLDAVVAPETAG